ncbi:hypothetical protein BAE44_0020413 [Dichanthelium oligosanthes]|uniref:Peptidase A1 domain-containing protein n=1 Tax=Dichanthelium oligosanthes TaxID=888268 RepID=A0A1E5V0E2_9POAL|nr:hypothetical protein BAE44_0020413 [Dichanthelium oligosanthes]
MNILSPSGEKKGDKLESAANSGGLYIFNISVGTPAPQIVTGVLDITLSFVWPQCEPCDPCLPPPAPTFLLHSSLRRQTCQSVLNQTCAADATATCGYIVNYADVTNTTGYLANDTSTFGPSAAPGVVFGCNVTSYGDLSGASGAFGRGALSLVSQLQLSWFSYFFGVGRFRQRQPLAVRR